MTNVIKAALTAVLCSLLVQGCDASSSEPKALRAIEKGLSREMESTGFSGAVLVARGDQEWLSVARGLADRERGVANTRETRFRLGSMNKMFTGVAIVQLAQAKRLDFQATLGTYLPDYPNRELASKVTIHHLLTHQGGTGNIFGPEFEAHRNELRAIDDYIALFGKRAVRFEPGSKFEYSNYGYVLLGAVIEKVSGQSYYDYVQKHIFEPAGMSSTGSEPEDQTVEARAVGYMEDGKSNTATLPYRGSPAGGGYSTVGDMHRFAQALLAHRLLDAQHTELLLTRKVSGEDDDGYAYGFGDARSKGGRGWVGHNGGAPGMNGALRIYPRSGYVVVALANVDPPAAEDVCGWISKRLPD